MDYLGDGAQTLRAALDAAKGQSRIALCIRALLESASGLMYAHQNTVVHGDIKPSNILIAQSDPSLPKVRLIDFGFAQITDGVAKLSDRHPSADSSVRRRIRIKDPFRSDIWALAKVFQVELAAAEREITRWDDPLKASLPLDYADLPELRRLLAEWADENAEAVVETHPPEEFFRRLFALDRPFSLAPDVKRGIRFLAVDELATAARLRPAFEAIRIPPRQLVLYTERIKELISTPEFGSLRYKRQLGFTHLVYPGAQGTRFEHSIGVYDLACRFVIQMAGHASFRSLAISEKDTLKFLVASLLHDVGHYPYAHQLEEFHREDFDTAAQSRVVNIIRGHEHYGALIVRKLGILRTRFGFSEEDLQSCRRAYLSRQEWTSRTAGLSRDCS